MDLEDGVTGIKNKNKKTVQLRPAKLSLTDNASIAAISTTIREEHSGCDMLINNAGVYYFRENITADERKETIDVNYCGTLRVCNIPSILIFQWNLTEMPDLSSIPPDHAQERPHRQRLLAVWPAEVLPSSAS